MKLDESSPLPICLSLIWNSDSGCQDLFVCFPNFGQFARCFKTFVIPPQVLDGNPAARCWQGLWLFRQILLQQCWHYFDDWHNLVQVEGCILWQFLCQNLPMSEHVLAFKTSRNAQFCSFPIGDKCSLFLRKIALDWVFRGHLSRTERWQLLRLLRPGGGITSQQLSQSVHNSCLKSCSLPIGY